MIEEDFVGQVALLNALIRRRLDHLVQPLGLSETNYYYIMIIGKTPGINQMSLIDKVARDQSSVTRQIERLVKQGWVEKRQAVEDRRASALFLTAKGKQIFPQLTAITMKVNQEALQKLPKKTSDKFQKLLYDVRQNFLD